MAFDWGSLLGTGAGVAGSLYAGNQAKQTAGQASDIQQQATNQALSNLQPYQALTDYALPKLTSESVNMADMPGYDFAQKQGEQSINRNLAAAGRYNSGAAQKQLLQFNNDLANQQYGQYYNRLSNMLGMGMQNANNQNALLTGMGNAGAAAKTAGSNANMQGQLGAAGTLANYLGTSGGQQASGQLANMLGSGIGSAASAISDWWNNNYGQNANTNAVPAEYNYVQANYPQTNSYSYSEPDNYVSQSSQNQDGQDWNWNWG